MERVNYMLVMTKWMESNVFSKVVFRWVLWTLPRG